MSFGQYSLAPKVSKPSLPSAKKRLRHVFDNPAHVWAHPREKDGSGFEQTEAWNAHKNFYFRTADDSTRILYSYRDTYPIGARFVHKKKPVYLVRSGKPYSSTTSGHMSQGSGAVPHDAIKFSVKYVVRYDDPSRNTYTYEYPRGDRPDLATHNANLADIIERIVEAIQKASKAHSLRTIVFEQETAQKLTKQAKEYAKLFDVKLGKMPTIPKLTEERRGKALAFDNSSTARRNARYAARNARYEEQRRVNGLAHEEQIDAWRAGSNVHFWNLNQDGFALLRVKGSNVETSQGVSVAINGLSGAGRLLRFLTACKDAGRPYRRNGHTEHIGNFTVESFQPLLDDKADVSSTGEWILIAGCHRIQWSEIETIREAVQTLYKPETLKTE
jgi:hypothetical protein